MARRLRFFTDQIEKSGHTLNQNPSLERTFDLDELEVKLESLERELLEVNANSDKLRRSHSELVELQLVLEKAGAFFEDARSTARTDDDVRSHSHAAHFLTRMQAHTHPVHLYRITAPLQLEGEEPSR